MPRPRRRPDSSVRILSPLRDFLAAEASGAVFLATGALIALVWANTPWSGSYESLWQTRVSFTIGSNSLALDLRHWINDGLMTIFFLLVGLEIKRELTHGHLSSRRAAMLPGVAALGGMLIPAMIYLAIAGGSAPRGWAVPIATDIALAVGILAVAGERVPAPLRAFLLGLAIVDDVGAIIVIAAVYSTGINLTWLTAALAAALAIVVLNRLHVWSISVYVMIGVFIWFCCHEAGIHPTIAGVAMGLLAPSTPRLRRELIDSDDLTDLSDVAAAYETTELAKGSVSIVEWLQHVLHSWSSHLIVPIFALANTGILLSAKGIGAAGISPVAWGVFLGLVVGKPLGIVMATYGAVRANVADMPQGTSRRQLTGVGSVGGIGFTVALFIAELAFTDAVDLANAKLAILAASVVAAAVSTLILTGHREQLPRAWSPLRAPEPPA